MVKRGKIMHNNNFIKELGPVEAIRFINIPRRKRMESIERHRKWQKMLDKSMFFDEIFAE